MKKRLCIILSLELYWIMRAGLGLGLGLGYC